MQYLTIKELKNLIKNNQLISNTKYKIIDYKPAYIDGDFLMLGHLEYRTVRFETQIHKQKAHMDRAVTNYTAADIPFTRIIDHKFFDDSTQKDYDVVTHEYPIPYVVGKTEPYYPVNNKKNNRLYKKYLRRNRNKNIYFKGRLGEYKYYDMDDTIRSALDFAKEELK